MARNIKLESQLSRKTLRLWQRFSSTKGGMVGLSMVIGIALVAILAPLIAPYEYGNTNAGPKFSAPSSHNLFGTDQIGRDILSGVIRGSRVSLTIGITSAIAATLLGTLVGALSGYYGGKIDDLLMRSTELVMIIPTFVLVVVFLAMFGSSIYYEILMISIVAWPGTAKTVRAEFARLREMDFVESAESIGASDLRIIFREILPNTYGVILVNAMLAVGFSILLASGLSFVGLGDPNQPDWGYMLKGATYYSNNGWWIALFPGVAIVFTTLGFNLLGDGLSYALNPRLTKA